VSDQSRLHPSLPFRGLGNVLSAAELALTDDPLTPPVLCICTYSDRYQTRGIPIMSVFAVGIVGWALLLAVDPVKATTSELRVRYFAVHCVVSAGCSSSAPSILQVLLPVLTFFPPPQTPQSHSVRVPSVTLPSDGPLALRVHRADPLVLTVMSWQAGNSACETQKAVSLGMLNSVGQCLSVAAAFAFPKIEGPRYTTGATVNVAMQTLGLTIALGMTLYYRWENRRRDKVEGGRPPKGMRIEGMQTDYDHAVGASTSLEPSALEGAVADVCWSLQASATPPRRLGLPAADVGLGCPVADVALSRRARVHVSGL